jgi:small subunit ribosomal protein S17
MKGIRKKTRTGVVVSNKMDKTVVVAVERHLRHPMYGKVVRKTPHFYAHDGKNQCQEGDLVRIAESRPLSKTKRWRVVEIVKKAQ